jgi:ssDNA-binding Zn-finger/Zn-ribbon topoisomerase 1
MPVMDLEIAKQRRQALIDFTKKIMKRDTDYGVIPGTGGKPTLYKPGAEKLSNFFGLSPTFDVVESTLDWTGQAHGGEAFFYYQYRCTLYHGGVAVGQGLGSCNSWEKKYRYRKGGHTCPDCGEAAIIKGKQEYGGGWLCFGKKGGCGHKWADGSPQAQTFANAKPGAVKNDNPADQVNTIDKMAQKRALVAAVLIAVNASEFFTQDIEDMPDIVEGSYEPVAPAPRRNNRPAPTAEPWTEPIAASQDAPELLEVIQQAEDAPEQETNGNGVKLYSAAKYREYLRDNLGFKDDQHVIATLKLLGFWPTPAKREDRKRCYEVCEVYRVMRDDKVISRDDALAALADVDEEA